MNVLIIANELNYSCGVTNHLLHLAKGLTESGKVNLWIICGGGNGISRFADINVTIISDERFLHINRTFSSFIFTINFLVKFIRKNEIDIIHSHSHYGAAIAKRASKLANCRTIQTNHGIIPEMGRLKHFNADKYVAINEHIERYIIENKITKKENIFFIRCGIPAADKPETKQVNGKLRVLAASRFVYEKGLDIYIHAVNKLPKEILDKAEFYIGGEGELDDELTELNNSLGGKINFAGRITDMYLYLSRTHILVNPSRSDNEGFPAIITEAGASNTLVISSDFRGAEDVLKDGNNSVIFKNKSSDSLCEALEKVISEYSNYTALSENFYRFIKKEFSVPLMTEKHISMYEQCLA